MKTSTVGYAANVVSPEETVEVGKIEIPDAILKAAYQERLLRNANDGHLATDATPGYRDVLVPGKMQSYYEPHRTLFEEIGMNVVDVLETLGHGWGWIDNAVQFQDNLCEQYLDQLNPRLHLDSYLYAMGEIASRLRPRLLGLDQTGRGVEYVTIDAIEQQCLNPYFILRLHY